MEKILKIVKVCINTVTTLIIIIGLVIGIMYAIGLRPFIVQSGSMEGTIKTGSLSFINKNASYENIKTNDIIGYTSSTGTKVMHRVVAIDQEGVHTKGDANETIDGNAVTKQSYIGKVVFWIPYLGRIIALIQTTRGKIVAITVIVVMILAAILIGEPSKKKEKNNDNEKQKDDKKEKIENK